MENDPAFEEVISDQELLKTSLFLKEGIQIPEQRADSPPRIPINQTTQTNQPPVQARPVEPASYLKQPCNTDFLQQADVLVNRYHEFMTDFMNKQQQSMSKYHDFMTGQLALIKTDRVPDNTTRQKHMPPVVKKKIQRPEVNLRSMRFKEEDLTQEQKKFMTDFIQKFNRKTAQSRAYAARYRATFSDWINSLNFHMDLKELIYPIVSAQSRGARFKDIDGNEYLDLALGYGISYFGHQPDFIYNALQKQLTEGIELGPQSDLAGQVSQLISEITGVERVAFCNTGSEAIMVALRLARTVTGKDKIFLFNSSYHGNNDIILAQTDEEGTFPVSPGMVEDIVVLDYGTKESLEKIKALGDNLAGVLVEPVQSRRPGFQPGEFLQELKQITRQIGSALIFDEVITGFRIHPGGAQHHFGVKADIVIYGKLIGGGMPLGIVAGNKEYLDAVDGGIWHYGDDSYPAHKVTFFAGTFCKHPLVLAAARAVLKKIKQEGPALQARVNRLTADFKQAVNDYFEAENVPLKVSHFACQFKFDIFIRNGCGLSPFELNLFFLMLIHSGIYTWERRICFFSTQHTEADVKQIINTIKLSIKRLRQGGFDFGRSGKKGGPGIKQTVTEELPMSSVQKRLFALCQLKDGDLPYHLTSSMLIEGRLDIARLKEAVSQVIARHESLRTSFHAAAGQFYQVIHSRVDPVIECKTIEEEQIEQEIKNFVSPFDLSKAPLQRVMIGIINEDKYLLVLDSHHIVFDGYSSNIMTQELMAFYRESPLPPVARQYRDYVEWERGYLQSGKFEEQKAYWQSQFKDLPESLALSLDFMRPPVKQFKGRTMHSVIDRQTTIRLKELAQAEGKTLFSLLLAVFQVLLFRLSRQEDICIGVPVAVREEGDFEKAMGMFTNNLVLRSYPEGNQCFCDYLAEVQAGFFRALSHKEFPYELLVEELGVRHSGSHNPLFDVMFVYENANERSFRLIDLNFTTYYGDIDQAMFDLTFEMIEENGQLNVHINYNRHLFREETVQRWQGHFKSILEAVIVDPAIKLREIDILSQAEKNQLLFDFNATAVSYPLEKTINQLFEEQAARTPDQLAVVFGEKQLSYQELNAKANQIAAVLCEKGVQPEDIVGILCQPSLEMIVSVVAVLKSGAAYLPIDPAYPAGRIAYMLKDSQAKLLLTETALVNESYAAAIICLDDPALDQAKPLLAGKPVKPGNLAYVIYTSGSTGKPKGVMVEHRALLNLCCWQSRYYELSEKDRAAKYAGFGFDVSVSEIWPYLLSGACLYVIDNDIKLDPIRLNEYFERKQITAAFLPTQFCEQFMELDNRSLRILLTAGDKLNSYIKRNYKLFNNYGPTESTVYATVYELNDPDAHIPIGKPIWNMKIYILGKDNQLLPIGTAGQLCIGGVGLARGYLNQAQLTAEKFVDNPFEPGEKMYQTGDLARWRWDGNIEFLGRMDDQVKIRGYRIELGEIESVLMQHKQIKACVVLARAVETGGKQLSAYYVSDEDPGPAELRDLLSDSLPDYMIPAYFIGLAEIPLTPNGKINRQSLPVPCQENRAAAVYAAPSNEIESKLVEIWQEVLDVKGVGILDDFFELGGHSLNVMPLISKMRERGFDTNINEIFLNSNIKALSETLLLRNKQ